jgi:hypothetical protein
MGKRVRRSASVLFVLGMAFSTAVAGLAVSPAVGDSPGCVTRHEYLQVRSGMTKAAVNAIFDTHGKFGDGGAGGYSRIYPRCHTSTGITIVEYAADPKGGAARVTEKWQGPARHQQTSTV